MNDYAKHIETLNYILKREHIAVCRGAITAAIELMRAAVPLNEEAERARLNTLVCRWLTDNDPRDGGLVGLFESEIAAARAEGWIAGENRLAGKRETELAAAKSEIERLRIDSATFLDSANDLNTKLANLRAAAERYEKAHDPAASIVEVCEAAEQFRAAIEASR